jgi:hypothetical protein
MSSPREPARKQSGGGSRIESDLLRHLAPRGEELRGGMSQGRASGALLPGIGVARYLRSVRYGTTSMASDRSLEITKGIMVRSFVRFLFACMMAVPARASTIVNGSLEDGSGIKAQCNGPWGSARITGWIVT